MKDHAKSRKTCLKSQYDVAFYLLKSDNYTVMDSSAHLSDTIIVSATKNTIETEIIQGITMVSIPGGSFEMGSQYGNLIEMPVHEVTQLALSRCHKRKSLRNNISPLMDNNPSHFTDDANNPVENVCWYDAALFCNKLSDEAGLELCYDPQTWECDYSKDGFRLPVEAEWEYACRAGTDTKFYNGNEADNLLVAGWYYENSGKTTSHPVGQKKANDFGLRDMHGNVWEWCDNQLTGYTDQIDFLSATNSPYKALRGGSWYNRSNDCRSAFRYGELPEEKNNKTGFRIVRGTLSVDTGNIRSY